MNFYKKLGEIRPNQLITTYGPGSIMDAVNDSLTVLDIEYWDTNNIGKEIRDARLASYMNVRRFFMPKTGGKEDIPVVSFPYYHVCSKGTCKFLFDMRDYFDMDQYKKNQGEVKCPKCGFPAYPSRFITVCEDGHMDDFPWRWWVHHGETSCKEDMYLKSMGNTSHLQNSVLSVIAVQGELCLEQCRRKNLLVYAVQETIRIDQEQRRKFVRRV